jgi:flagellar L-ring protein precursor FlgH
MKARFQLLCEVAVGCVLVLGPVRADSLWHEQTAPSLFADRKACGVGDIVTIVVQESSTASKNNNTTTSKKSSVNDAIAAFLFSPAGSAFLTHGGQLPALNYSAESDFNGGGTIQNNEQIVANVSVRVIDVLPNKNMVLEGTRHTAFGSEQQDIVLRGVVRPEDIAANNTVFSYNVADATVKIINKGAVTDSQRKGWFMRLWDKVNPL